MNITPRVAYSARLATIALLATFLCAGPALSAVRIGTNGSDTLIGTVETDQITGKGGNDILKGRAGNDTYVFADPWGTDTLIEKAGEGSDTVDFHAVTSGPVSISLVPEWADADPSANSVTGPGGQVLLAYKVNGQTIQSVVENPIGGQGDGTSFSTGDIIMSSAGKNIIQPGGGATDVLYDVAGWNDGPAGNPDIPISNDVYKGFASNTGTDLVSDWGGSGDVLDMRPFATRDVVLAAINLDDNMMTLESLQIVTGPTGQVVIAGQFGDINGLESDLNYHGHIETIRFADKTFSTTSALQSLATTSTAATSEKQAQLAKVAAGLAKEARGLIDPKDPLGLRPSPSGRVAASGMEPPRADQHETKHKQAKHGDQDRQRRQP